MKNAFNGGAVFHPDLKAARRAIFLLPGSFIAVCSSFHGDLFSGHLTTSKVIDCSFTSGGASKSSGGSMPTICLNMIVKNEVANLQRCLAAVAGHIDCWVIGDTGSSDGTQDFIRAFFAERGLPGELHCFPFVNFEQARNEALARAYASPLQYDYLLFDDADMELVVENADFRTGLEAPAYQLIQRAASGMVYRNTRLARRDAGARYRGVTHEYLDVAAGTRQLSGVWYNDHANGTNRADKFKRDIRLLTGALETEEDPFLRARYTFYLAQSYRDCGEKTKAIEAYLRRADQGYWDQEVFYSLYRAAQLKEELGHDRDEVVATYLRAAEAAPNRAEALHGASRLCRNAGRNQQGYEIAKRGLGLTAPPGGLFVEPWIYDYGLLDEFAVTAFWAAHYRESLGACLQLLAHSALPDGYRDRLAANARLALDNLHQHSTAGTPHAMGSAPPGVRLAMPAMADEATLGNANIEFTNNWFDITAKDIWDTLIPQISPRKILEIGSYEGASACYLIANCASKAPIELHCIDTWEGSIENKAVAADMTAVERRFLDNTRIARGKIQYEVELIMHKGYSNICISKLTREKFFNYFDLIYVDGSHQAPDVLSDAILSFPLLRVGGMMIFDDYTWSEDLPQGRDPLRCPKPAIDAFINIYFRKMRIVLSRNSQVCAEKTSE